MAKHTSYLAIKTDQAAHTNGSTPSIEVKQYDGYMIQTVFSAMGTGTTTGTCSLEISADNSNFATYPSSAQNYSSGTSSLAWEITTKRHPYVRMTISGATGTATGTCTTSIYTETFVE